MSLRSGRKIYNTSSSSDSDYEEATPEETKGKRSITSSKKTKNNSTSNTTSSTPTPSTSSKNTTGNNSEKQNCNKNSNMPHTFDQSLFFSLVPTFSGEPTQLHKFLSSCDAVKLTCTTAEDHLKFFTFVKLKLADKAYELIKYRSYENYDELVEDLKAQYGITKPYEQIQTELVKIKQGNRESDLDYSNKVGRLLADLNVSSGADQTSGTKILRDLNERTALNAYLEGMRDSLRIIIKAYRHNKLSDAISSAIIEGGRMPIKLDNYQQNTETSKKYCSHCKKNGHSYQECRSKLKCYKCGRIGHKAPDCRIATPTARHIKQENETHSTRINIVKCRYCRTDGHDISNCMKKKKSDERTVSQNSSHPEENQYSKNYSGVLRDKVQAEQLQ